MHIKYGDSDGPRGEPMTCMCQFSTADRIVVWSVRTWGWDRAGWRDVERGLGVSLGAADGLSLTRNLYGLYCLIGRSATREFLLRPIGCRCASEDERMLIGALAEAQQDNWPLAVAFLEDFLPRDCVRYAFHPIATAAARWAAPPQPGLLGHAALDPYRHGAAAPRPIASH